MILSNHGELEFGSPKVPGFPEALLLHHLDNLDSKMECMRAFLQKDRFMEGCWTGYSSSLERSILKKERFLEDPEDSVPVALVVTVEELQPHVAAPPVAPKPPQAPASKYQPQSLFAEKLKGALHEDS